MVIEALNMGWYFLIFESTMKTVEVRQSFALQLADTEAVIQICTFKDPQRKEKSREFLKQPTGL